MRLEHKFVEFIPRDLEEGVLYISIRFSTAVHKCACGCGIKTVTPISPTDWKLSFNGKYVSLYPSIGNWQFPCRSHYWITENKVRWSDKWNERDIKANRQQSNLAKNKYFDSQRKADDSKVPWWKFKWLFGKN